MKFVNSIILFTGVSLAFHQSGPSAQLPAFGELAKILRKESAVLNNLNGYISETGDAFILTGSVKGVIIALEALSKAVSKVSAAISRGKFLRGVNEGLEEWCEAETVLTAAYDGALNDSSPGSLADLYDYANGLKKVSTALSGLAGAVSSLPRDSAVVLGSAAIYYGFTSTGISRAEYNIAVTIHAVTSNTKYAFVFKSVAKGFNRISSADADVSAALVNAANK